MLLAVLLPEEAGEGSTDPGAVAAFPAVPGPPVGLWRLPPNGGCTSSAGRFALAVDEDSVCGPPEASVASIAAVLPTRLSVASMAAVMGAAAAAPSETAVLTAPASTPRISAVVGGLGKGNEAAYAASAAVRLAFSLSRKISPTSTRQPGSRAS